VSKSARARGLDAVSAADPELPDVTWKYALRDGKLTTERIDSAQVERFVIEYVFGSGRHAATFLTLTGRDPSHPASLEHRLTAFTHSGTLGLTPGQSLSGHATGNTTHGRFLAEKDTLKCFGCHTTRSSDQGPEVLSEATMIANVTCERCHGPASAHLAATSRGAKGEALRMPFGPERWTTAQQMEMCGRCHRLPAMVRPGSIRIDNPALVRHQPVGLMQSACFQKSHGTLNCVSCHDPHARPSRDTAAYEAVCLSCHGGKAGNPCPIGPKTGCIPCHMPIRDVGRGMKMTDHWIRSRMIPDTPDTIRLE
jgi:Cytochrome c554 and c-prime